MTAPTFTPHPTETADQQDTAPASAPDTASGAVPAEAAGCPACPHPMAEHDPIGARFCRATVAGAYRRGCVCRH
jgi:hypothetical protein